MNAKQLSKNLGQPFRFRPVLRRRVAAAELGLVWLLTASFSIVLAAACFEQVNPALAPQPVLGRWLLTFHIKGGLFRTPMELVADSSGMLRVAALGPPLVQFERASVENGVLRLEGASRFGRAHISGHVIGDSLQARWRIKILRGDVTGHRLAIAPSSSLERVAALDSAWSAVSSNFYDPSFGGVDWAAMHTRYAPQATAARNDGELLAVMRQMLAELHSSHLDISEIMLADAFPTRGGGSGTDEAEFIAWRAITPRIGYLRIAQFDEGLAAIARLDSAFSVLGALPGLIVDVRGNPGGTLGAALRLGDHLSTKPTPVGYFATRGGLRSFGVTSISELDPASLPRFRGYNVDDFLRELRRAGALTIETGGRVTRPYAGRVVLLVDEGCGSTTEALAAVLQELHRATLVGHRTAGAMLSSAEIPIVGGWVLRLPEADFRTPAGRQVEGTGVTPDVIASRHWYRDSQLRAGVSLLEH
jgi:hypothetical protein